VVVRPTAITWRTADALAATIAGAGTPAETIAAAAPLRPVATATAAVVGMRALAA